MTTPTTNSATATNSTLKLPNSSSSPKIRPPSFPPAVFAALAPALFLHAHLTQPSGLRPCGRKPNEFRKPHVNLNSLSHAFGSSLLRTGDTVVLCGVRGEILMADDVADIPKSTKQDAAVSKQAGEEGEGMVIDGADGESEIEDDEDDEGDEDDEDEQLAEEILHKLNLVVPNINLSTGASPSTVNPPGAAPSAMAQTLSSRILFLLHSTRLIRPSRLFIKHRNPETGFTSTVGFWTLYIDITFLSLRGNPFDIAWASLVCALRTTYLPFTTYDADLDSIFCSVSSHAQRLSLRSCPFAATFRAFDATREKGIGAGVEEGQKKRWILADPDDMEESICREEMTIVVDSKAENEFVIRGIEQGGGGTVHSEAGEMDSVVNLAKKRWCEWHNALLLALKNATS